MNHRFPKQLRVVKQADFDRAYHGKVYATDQTLVVQAARNGLDHARLGLSVSRKVGNAVLRNRWKRMIREAFRTQREVLPTGIDFVVRPRKGAVADPAAVRQSMLKLTVRLGKRLAGDAS